MVGRVILQVGSRLVRFSSDGELAGRSVSRKQSQSYGPPADDIEGSGPAPKSMRIGRGRFVDSWRALCQLPCGNVNSDSEQSSRAVPRPDR